MEAEKSHDLLSASWRPRKAWMVQFWSKCKGLRALGEWMVKFWSKSESLRTGGPMV